MATLEREDPREEKEENDRNEGFASIHPLPLDLMFPEAVETFTDHEAVSDLLPDIRQELSKCREVAPPLPPRSPLLEDEQSGADTEIKLQEVAILSEIMPSVEPSAPTLQETEEGSTGVLSTASNTVKTGEIAKLHEIFESERFQQSLTGSRKAELYPTIQEIEYTSSVTVVKLERREDVLQRESVGFMSHSELLDVDMLSNVLKGAASSPYVNTRLNEMFESLSDSALRLPAKNEPVLVGLVKAYRDAEASLDDCLNQVSRKMEECRLKESLVWVKKTGVAEQSQPLRTGVGEVKANVNFQLTQFSRKKAHEYEQELAVYEDSKSSTLLLYQFERSMALFQLERHISSRMAMSSLFSPTVDPSEESEDTQGLVVAESRMIFSVLLSFEIGCREEARAVPSHLEVSQNRWRRRFLNEIRILIIHVGSALLQTGHCEDRAFLLSQLTAYGGIGSQDGSWALQLLQLGPVLTLADRRMRSLSLEKARTRIDWNESVLDDFVAMMQIILQNMVPDVESQSAQLGHVSVEKDIRKLSEADCIAVMDQCSLEEAFEYIFPLIETSCEGIQRWFSRASFLMRQFCSAVDRLVYYSQLCSMFGECIVKLVSNAFRFLKNLKEIVWSGGVSSQPLAVAQLFFDSICLQAGEFFMSIKDANLRLKVKGLPIHALSIQASWRFFLAIFLRYQGHDLADLEGIVGSFAKHGVLEVKRPCPDYNGAEIMSSDWEQSEFSDFSEDGGNEFHQHESVCSLPHWRSATQLDPALRRRFWSVACEGNASEGKKDILFRFIVLAFLAEQGSLQLAHVILEEILIVVFLREGRDVKWGEETLVPLRNLIGDICKVHPTLLSICFRAATQHEEKFVHHGLAFFESLPLQLWRPNATEDVPRFRKWLLPAPNEHCLSPFCRIAMAIISRMNWSTAEANFTWENIHSSKLFISPLVHRDVATLIIEACLGRLLHLSIRSSSRSLSSIRRWIPLTQDYKEESELDEFTFWSWNTIIRFSFFSATSFQSLVVPFDIEDPHDTSNGGILRQLWRSTIDDHERNIDLRPSNGPGTIEQHVHPLLAYGLLFLTNFVESQKSFLPLLVLRQHAYFGASSSRWSVFAEKAYLQSLFYQIPRWVSNNGVRNLIPTADILVGVQLTSTLGRERSGSMVNEVLSRVFSGAAASAHLLSVGAVGNGAGQGGKGQSLDRKSSFSSQTSSSSSRKNSFTTQTESWEDLSLVIQAHLALLSHNFEDGNELARRCAIFWFEQITSVERWSSLSRCRLILDRMFRNATVIDVQYNDTLLVAHLEKCLVRLTDSFGRREGKSSSETSSLSILPAEMQGNFFSKHDVAGVVPDCSWLSFYALLIETSKEYPLWAAFGHLLTDPSCKFSDVDEARSSLRKSVEANEISGDARQYLHDDLKKLSQYRIYRWANYALMTPSDHPLLILFWQVFFVMYFSRSGSHFYGFRFLSRSKRQTRKANLREELLARAKNLKLHYANAARSREHENSATKKLADTYGAFELWLRDPNPGSWLSNRSALGNEFCVSRLGSILDSSVLETLYSCAMSFEEVDMNQLNSLKDALWLDLVDTNFSVIENIFVESWSLFPGSSVNGSSVPRSRAPSSSVEQDSSQIISSTRKAMPVYLYREPQSTAKETLEDVDLAGILQTLERFSVMHAEKISQFHNLVKSLVEHLPRLYSKETRMKVVEKLPPTGKEKEVYVFEISYDESVINEGTVRTLSQLWSSCEKFDFGWELDQKQENDRVYDTNLELWKARSELCTSLMMLTETVENLVIFPEFCSKEEDVRVIRLGTEWFRGLLAAENRATRGFPPVQHALWTCIAKCGTKFAKGKASEAPLILTAMTSDLSRVHLLSSLFQPSLHVERIFELYASFWEEIPRIPSTECWVILEKFDFSSWLKVPPSKELRHRLLSMLGEVLRQKGWKPAVLDEKSKSTEKMVFDFHLNLLFEVCNIFFVDHFPQCVEILVGASFIWPAENSGAQNEQACTIAANPKVWDTILNVPAERWDDLSFDSIVYVCENLGAHFRALRRQGSGVARSRTTKPGALIRQWKQLGLVDPFVKLAGKLTVLMCNEIKQYVDDESIIGREMLLRAWSSVSTIFLPWISSTDYFEANNSPVLQGNDGNRITESAWDFQDGTEGRLLFSCFVKCCKCLDSIGSGVEPYWILDRTFWMLFEEVLPGSPEHVATTALEVSQAMPWENWALSGEALQEMSSLVLSGDPHSILFKFSRSVLEKLNWRDTERCFGRVRHGHGRRLNIHEFYATLLQTLVRITMKHNLPLPESFSNFFFQVANGLPWFYVVPVDFSSVVTEVISGLGGSRNAEGHGRSVEGGPVGTATFAQQSSDQQRTAGRAQLLDSHEKRVISVIRLLGFATSLSRAAQQLTGTNWLEESKFVGDALRREGLLINGLSHMLHGVVGPQRMIEVESNEANVLESSDPESAPESTKTIPNKAAVIKKRVVEESARLNLSPGAFVMVFFESVERIQRVMAHSAWSLDPISGEDFSNNVSAHLRRTMSEVLGSSFGILNIPGATFVNPELVRPQLDSFQSGMTDVIFDKMETMVRSWSTMLPSAVRIDGGVVSNQGSSLSNRSTGRPSESSFASNQFLKSWESWGEMWKHVLPVMLAVTQQKPPFFARLESDQDRARDLSRLSLLRRRSSSSGSRRQAADIDASDRCSADRVAVEYGVSQAGCGVVLFCLTRAMWQYAPQIGRDVIYCVKDPCRLVEVLESCAEAWLERRNDLHPLILKWWSSEIGFFSQRQSHQTFRQVAVEQGAWLCLYVHSLYLLNQNMMLMEDDGFLRISELIVSCVQVHVIEEKGRPYLRPSPHFIIPLVYLFFELCLSSQHSETVKVQQLYVVLDSLQTLASEQSGMLATLAAAVLNRLSFLGSGVSHTGGVSGMSGEAASSVVNNGEEIKGGPNAQFKLFFRCLAPYIFLNSKRNSGLLRTEAGDALNMNSKKAQQALAHLSQHYEGNRVALWAASFSRDESNSLLSAHRFIEELTHRVFPNVPWLRRPSREWALLRIGAVQL